jgi:dynein heavy chain 1
MGGKPFGPAGTGKTESVKALGVAFGLPVFVFCCDENFNLAAMARIFSGLCELGAWGCFDEFNRLDPGSLSAVSAQITAIQHGLQDDRDRIDLEGKSIGLNTKVGIFITMNPKYIGRSKLPENLKNLFRGVAMVKPDTLSIGEVKLFTQGFVEAKSLSSKVVTLFDLCEKTLSKQKHYDFGLRSLKSVLATSGQLKRSNIDEDEIILLLKSLQATIAPKLVQSDRVKYEMILSNLFSSLTLDKDPRVQQVIEQAYNSLKLVDNPAQTTRVEQVVQLLT